MGFRREERATGFRRFWPVVGFFLVVVFGILAFVISPSVIQFAQARFPGFTGREIDPMLIRIGFTVFIVFIFVAIFGMLLAMTAPKRSFDTIKDSDLQKERKAMLERKEMEKRRQRRLNREMRK